MTKDELVKVYKLATYAEFCAILLFENGYEGKSQSLLSKAKTALEISGVEDAGISRINESY